jgi:hypothetical protein
MGTSTLVAQGGEASVGFLAGNGGGTFAPERQIAVPRFIGLWVAEANADRRPDVVVVAASSGDTQLLIGHGDGTFQEGMTIAPGGSTSPLGLGDFNGDGKADVLTYTMFDGGQWVCPYRVQGTAVW